MPIDDQIRKYSASHRMDLANEIDAVPHSFTVETKCKCGVTAKQAVTRGMTPRLRRFLTEIVDALREP